MENNDNLKLRLQILKLKAVAKAKQMKMRGKDRITDFGEKIGGSAKDRFYNTGSRGSSSMSKSEKTIYYAVNANDGAVYASYYKNNNLKGSSYYINASYWWEKHGKPYYKVFELEGQDREDFENERKENFHTIKSPIFNTHLTTLQINIINSHWEEIKSASKSILEQHANDSHEKPVYLHFRMRRNDYTQLCFASYTQTYQRNGLNVCLFDTQKRDDYNRIFGSNEEEYRKRWQESRYSTYGEFLREVIYWEYVWSHNGELKAQARQMLGEGFTDKADLVAAHRYGIDWLEGRNATEQDFLDTFGFRAVEFGESMPQKERREHMNRAFEAFMDLAHTCGFSPSAIAHGGTLALALGSRGRGGYNAASAHYEPIKNVINLTRRIGAGSLAHEWWHSLDRNLLKRHKEINYASDINNNNIDNVNSFYEADTAKNIRFLASTIHTCLFKRSLVLDRNKRNVYWTQSTEMSARSFEAYVIRKMHNEGIMTENKPYVNEYLAQIPEYNATKENWYPYPKDEELDEHITKAFDDLFAHLKEESGIRRNTALRGNEDINKYDIFIRSLVI